MSSSTYVSLGITSQYTARSISKKVSWICPKAKINVEKIVEDHWLKTKIRISCSHLGQHRYQDTAYHDRSFLVYPDIFIGPEILGSISARDKLEKTIW